MKKNTKTYILLTIVALIWGTIGYRILSSFSPEEPNNVLVDRVDFKPIPTKKKDTFSIVANYRDPFLGTMPTTNSKRKIRSNRKPPQEALPEIDIRYTGFITETDTKQKIFFVTINGEQHLMSSKDKVGDVTLLNGTAKSITVRARKKSRTIPIQE